MMSENNFVEWDDLFNGDYTDHRLREMVTVDQAIKKHMSEYENKSY